MVDSWSLARTGDGSLRAEAVACWIFNVYVLKRDCGGDEIDADEKSTVARSCAG